MYLNLPFPINFFLLLLLFVQCHYDLGVKATPVLARTFSNDRFISIDLSKYYNHQGYGDKGNMDGLGTHLVRTNTTVDTLTVGTIPFTMRHNYGDAELDNVVARGQTITLPSHLTGALYMLVADTHGPMTSNIIVTYADKSTSTTPLSLPDWQYNEMRHVDRFDVLPQTLSNKGPGALFSVPIYIDPSQQATTLTLPNPASSDPNAANLHVFAITSIQASPVQALQVISVRPLQGWQEGKADHQLVSIRVHNTGSDWIQNATLSMSGSDVQASPQDGPFSLAPGHTAVVFLAVKSSATPQSPVTVSVSAVDADNRSLSEPAHVQVALGLMTHYQKAKSSLQYHQAPQWLRRAKFGIFIHWGLYSVPAWAPAGQEYAEWYWWQSTHPNDPTYQHHLQKYGANFAYDDFMHQWKPTQFDPHAWLSLIDASKARYFVFTTKHHDGIALFNTNVTDRSTTKLLQPNRDFVQELIQTAKKSYAHLRRGLYFSLPEWFNPAYNNPEIGWHGPPVNPFLQDKPTIPYTGSRPIKDFVNELQLPQFRELIHSYEPDIMWCDIGGINNSTEWQAEYFNQAHRLGREVAINDRCGNGMSDFSTSEYTTVDDVPPRFWEATRGIDPHSFGYNSQTPDDQYANATFLIQTLINSVSLGGNLLLDIGPEASGAVPAIMETRLKEIGAWLDKAEASVFDADPHWVSPGTGNVRFTAARDGSAFYVFCMQRPGTALVIDTPLPVNDHASITLMGDTQSLSWKRDNGHLTIDVPSIVADRGKFVWVFQIQNIR